MKLTTHLHLVQKVNNAWLLFLHSLYAFMTCLLVMSFLSVGSLNCSHHPPGDLWVWYYGGIILTGENPELGEKPVPVPFCPPQIPHGLIWSWTWTSAVKGRQLSFWAMARPDFSHRDDLYFSIMAHYFLFIFFCLSVV
jgi:hypothetical protein